MVLILMLHNKSFPRGHLSNCHKKVIVIIFLFLGSFPPPSSATKKDM